MATTGMLVFFQAVIVYLALLFVTNTRGQGKDMCSIENVHESTSKCLSKYLVDSSINPLVPIFNDSAAVVNFCARHINDIETCYKSVISACTSDKRVNVVFGQTGAAMLAALDGICKEPNKVEDLTCAHANFAHNITHVVRKMSETVDHMDMQNSKFAELCGPMHELHYDINAVFEEAVQHGDCSNGSHDVIMHYMSTLVFPCSDVATNYYPCTLERMNADAMECYAKYGVIVRNALIPTPASPSKAEEMCSSKGAILSCIRSLLTKCRYEPPLAYLFGPAMEPFDAALECMCSPEKIDQIPRCAASADVTSAMTHFTDGIHNLTITGTLTKDDQCSMERTLEIHIEQSLGRTCKGPSKDYWRNYLATVIYPCTLEATKCYPEQKKNGAAQYNTGSFMSAILFFVVLILSLFV